MLSQKMSLIYASIFCGLKLFIALICDLFSFSKSKLKRKCLTHLHTQFWTNIIKQLYN